MGYLAGFPQVFLFGLGAVVFYGLYVSSGGEAISRSKRFFRLVRIFITSGFVSMLLVSIQLIPFMEYYFNSKGLHYPIDYVTKVFVTPPVILLKSVVPGLFGNPVEGTDWSDLPRQLVHPYNPDFTVYCGLGVLILALASLSNLKSSRRLQAMVILLLSSIAVAVNSFVLRVAYYLLPMFRASRVDRITVIACFAIASMAAIGFDNFSRSPAKKRKAIVVAIVIVVGSMVVLSLVLTLGGQALLTHFANKVRSFPDDYWQTLSNISRSGKIKEWAEAGRSTWFAYELSQLRYGWTMLATTVMLLVAFVLSVRNLKKVHLVISLALIGWIGWDAISTAKTYYVSQPPGSVRTTQGIEWLRSALGKPGMWRTKPLHQTTEDVLVLPCNTNQIFGLQSLGGQSTVYPDSYAYLKRNKIATEATITTPIFRRTWLASPVDDLMGVRFLLARHDQRPFTCRPVLREVSMSEDPEARLGIFETSTGRKIALIQQPGDTMAVELGVPFARKLAFKVGFHCPDSQPGDSVYFTLKCKTDFGTATYSQGFDLNLDRNRWHLACLKLKGVRGRIADMVLTVEARDTALHIEAAWAGFEYVIRDLEYLQIDGGYKINVPGRGRALSLELKSSCWQVPLRIHFGDGSLGFRWILFRDHVTRTVWIDLKHKSGQSILLASDSTFSITSVRKIWRGWTRDLDCELIYDRDMAVYENMGAMERGLCLDYSKVVRGRPPGKLRLTRLEDINSARCGNCQIVVYEPERVVTDVETDRRALFILQDMAYPGWSVYVDGRKVDMLPTDIGIRAIEIGPGRHRIVMTYHPLTFYIGLGLSCLGVLLTIGVGAKKVQKLLS